MSSSRWQKLFSKKKKESKTPESDSSSAKRPASNSAPSRPSKNDPQEMAKQKQEIEQFKKLISKKISDPSVAKKAAQIIEDLLNEEPKDQNKSKNNKKAS